MYQTPIKYQTTALEDWVSNLYKNKLGIHTPKQIDEMTICRYYRIFLHRKNMEASYQIIGRYTGIVVDKRLPFEIQRESFFHELCHILRHSGTQSMMPEAFRELQEWDAQNFVRYATIPHHMINLIDFDDPQVIMNMSDMFKVTPELCEQRLLQIKRRTGSLVGRM